MHIYSTDNDLRPKVYAYLAILSYFSTIAIANIVNIAYGFFPNDLTLNILFGVPSWGLVFAILTGVFNRWGWKTSIVREIGLVQVPDLNGEWEGWVTETRSDFPEEHDNMKIEAEISIKQTWRKIVIDFETGNSESNSIGATILTEQSLRPSIIHHYKNEPKHSNSQMLDMHYGTSNMTLQEEQVGGEKETVLSGFHYTGPQRETNGELWFKRVEDSK